MVAKIYRRIFWAIFIVVTLTSNTVFASEPIVDTRVAKKIAKEKGVLQPTEVLQWKTEAKEIPKDWIKIDNKYFSVSYPKCFSLEGEEGDEDPKTSPLLVFKRSSSCHGFTKNDEYSNRLSIGYFFSVDLSSVDKAFAADYPLVRQKVNINSIEAISLGGLMDYYDEVKDHYESQFRWQIFTICNKKTYRIVSTVPPGKPTMALVEKNKYDFPDDFKKIVSTFQCK